MPRNRWLVGDTETTGATPDDKVVELAWLEVDDNLAVIDRQQSLIDPQRLIPVESSAIHNIVDADVADAPTMDEFFDVVLKGTHFAPDDEVTLIAHNAAFDIRYLAPRVPIKRTLCTLRLARQLHPEAPNHKLATLMYMLKLQKGASHRASGDVETTYDLLCKLVAKSGKTLSELVEDSVKPIWVNLMPFGKHKDTKMISLPRSYVQWLLGRDNIDSDLRWTCEQIQKGVDHSPIPF